MYKTPARKWLKSIAVDSALISALVAGIIFQVPYVLDMSVFFLWWTSILFLFFGSLILFIPLVLETTIRNAEAEMETATSETEKQRINDMAAKARTTLKDFWKPKAVERNAVSSSFLVYHWVSDIVVWSLLIVSGNVFLASFKVASFLLSCILIGVARRKYREMHGFSDPDAIVE